jgi:hypothetical protein
MASNDYRLTTKPQRFVAIKSNTTILAVYFKGELIARYNRDKDQLRVFKPKVATPTIQVVLRRFFELVQMPIGIRRKETFIGGEPGRRYEHQLVLYRLGHTWQSFRIARSSIRVRPSDFLRGLELPVGAD